METFLSIYEDIKTIKNKLNNIEKTLAVNKEARDRNLLVTLYEDYGTLSKLYQKLNTKISKKKSAKPTVSQQNLLVLVGSNNKEINLNVNADQSTGGPPLVNRKKKKIDILSPYSNKSFR